MSGPEGIKVLSLRENQFAQVVETITTSLALQTIKAIKDITGAPKKEKCEE